jgi:glutamate racemase
VSVTASQQGGRPIGVFDSGVGGLTVCRALVDAFPGADIVYLGDTARVPYGTKSPATIEQYALNATRFLLSHDVGAIVIACHTASAVAMEAVRAASPVPALGMVEAAAFGVARRLAERRAEDGYRVAILGTRTTVSTGAHARAIAAAQNRPVLTELTASSAGAGAVTAIGVPCPLFVSLADEGLTEGPIATAVAGHYLGPLQGAALDAALLGCTHYPLLRGVVGEALGPAVDLIDPADEVVRLAAERGPPSLWQGRSRHRFFVTDAPAGFERVCDRFFGQALGEPVELVDLQSGARIT